MSCPVSVGQQSVIVPQNISELCIEKVNRWMEGMQEDSIEICSIDNDSAFEFDLLEPSKMLEQIVNGRTVMPKNATLDYHDIHHQNSGMNDKISLPANMAIRGQQGQLLSTTTADDSGVDSKDTEIDRNTLHMELNGDMMQLHPPLLMKLQMITNQSVHSSLDANKQAVKSLSSAEIDDQDSKDSMPKSTEKLGNYIGLDVLNQYHYEPKSKI